MALTLLAAAVACSGTEQPAGTETLSDDLRRDLELAKSSGLELASSSQAFQRAHVVSPIELSPGSVTRPVDTKAARPRPAPRRKPPTPPKRERRAEPAPEPVTVAAAAPEPAPTPEPVAPEPAPIPEPVTAPQPEAPRPVPLPAPEPTPIPAPAPDGGPGRDAPDAEGEGEDDGIGDVIAVVIRGGSVDGDHCERHQPGRPRPTVGRIPLPTGGGIDLPGSVIVDDVIPVGRPTFPRW